MLMYQPAPKIDNSLIVGRIHFAHDMDEFDSASIIVKLWIVAAHVAQPVL